MKITKGQAKAGAKWWAWVLKDPKFQMLGPPMSEARNYELANNRDAEWGEIMGLLLNRENSIDDEVLQRFSEILEENIVQEGHPHINVDYGPDRILYNSLVEAGGDPNSVYTFPWKTSMSFWNDKVEVSYGYGEPYQQIYPIEVSDEEDE